MLTFLGPAAAVVGLAAVSASALTSGVLGVLFALAQHDLKRLLAYHSVENIGIIALGLGVGLLGPQRRRRRPLAVLGLRRRRCCTSSTTPLFKGLLFLGAGAVAHATGTREIDHLGGLLKRMPWTGATFLVGAVAISGLPPLNGFVSEFLIYLGAFHGADRRPRPAAAVPVLVRDRRAGADRRAGGGLLHQGLRHRLPRRAAQRARGARARAGAGDAGADAGAGRGLCADRAARAAGGPRARSRSSANVTGLRAGRSCERQVAQAGGDPVAFVAAAGVGLLVLIAAARGAAAPAAGGPPGRREAARGTAATRSRRRACSTRPRRSPSR